MYAVSASLNFSRCLTEPFSTFTNPGGDFANLNEALAHTLNGIQLDRQLVIGVDGAGALHDGAYLIP